MLDVIKLNFLSKGSLTGKLSEKLKSKGLFGAFFLGVIFAFAFCPYSGALFFAMLIPLALSTEAGMGLPVLYAIGTGLPVILFSLVIAYSLERLGIWFKAISKVEKWVRIIAGITFIVTGIYYILLFFDVT